MKKIVLDGRLTADPVIKETANGVMATFSIANNDTPTAEFYNIVAWNHNAKIAGEHLKKGMYVVLSGTFKKAKYVSNGTTKHSFEITADGYSFHSAEPFDKGGDE